MLRGAAPDDPASFLVERLNACAATPEDLDPRSYLALAGEHTTEWVEAAQAQLRDRFGVELDARLFGETPRPGLFVAYAYMAKSWRFTTPFHRMRGWLTFPVLRGAKVDSFNLGPWGEDTDVYEARAEQVLVHHHRFIPAEEPGRKTLVAADGELDFEPGEPTEEFVVELLTEDGGDRLILARAIARPTLGAMVDWAVGRLRSDVGDDPSARLGREEKLQIPCIDFDLTRRYGELYGKRLANSGFEASAFGAVAERVRFQLDEGGAKLVSESDFRGLCAAPREILFDGPFLLMVLRRGALRPFVAMWVATPELLVRAQ